MWSCLLEGGGGAGVSFLQGGLGDGWAMEQLLVMGQTVVVSVGGRGGVVLMMAQ